MATYEMLTRKICPSVEELLNSFTHVPDLNNLKPEDWLLFYKFIHGAFGVTRNERPGVSQLSDILRKKNCHKPGSLAVLYAHGLYILANHHQFSIYGENFNP